MVVPYIRLNYYAGRKGRVITLTVPLSAVPSSATVPHSLSRALSTLALFSMVA